MQDAVFIVINRVNQLFLAFGRKSDLCLNLNNKTLTV